MPSLRCPHKKAWGIDYSKDSEQTCQIFKLCAVIKSNMSKNYRKFCILFCRLLIFFKINFLEKILTGLPSECQTVWIQIRLDKMSGLIWVQTVCTLIYKTSGVRYFTDILRNMGAIRLIAISGRPSSWKNQNTPQTFRSDYVIHRQ